MVGWDPAGPTLWKRDTAEDELSGTSYGAMLILAKITRLMNSKAKLHHDKDNKSKRSLASRADVVDYLVPYSYARVFHPQIPLHKKIASLVVLQMSMDHDARRGYATWTNLNQNTCCALGNTWLIPRRTVWGYELNKCYNFKEIPDTDCREYIGTKEKGGCSGGLSPHSVLVRMKGTTVSCTSKVIARICLILEGKK
ncbi:hypothetical protein QX201_003975 [Fusarium graminearum]